MNTMTTFLSCALVFFLSLNALSVSAADQPPAYKGIELGSGISKIIQDKRFICKRTDSPVAEQSCRLLAGYTEDLYGAPLSTLTLNYFNSKLSTMVITFESIHFKAIRDGLKQAYGPPKRSVEKYVTPKAWVFKGYIYTWKNQAFVIDAVEYFSAAGESAVLYKIEPDP